MELEVGGVYRTRGGLKVEITKKSNNTAYPYHGLKVEITKKSNNTAYPYHNRFLGNSGEALGGQTYTETGHVFLEGEDYDDIVAVWEDKEVATSVPAKYNEDERGRLVNTQTPDAIFQPNHYTRLYPEPITVINAWGLNFNLGNAVKYIARSGHKDGNAVEQDLSKAKRYIEIELERLRREKAIATGEATRSILVETM